MDKLDLRKSADTAPEFERLIRAEDAWVTQRSGGVAAEASPLAIQFQSKGDEPWVCWTPHDRLGLALSGGGIRSATFNLGLLQALSRPIELAPEHKSTESVLDLVDYLSTVSGGGYVGGFWSCWLHDQTRTTRPGDSAAGSLEHVFPQPERSGTRAVQAEAKPVRRLREHSSFLVPRVGLFDQDMWSAIVSVIGAALPSLLIAAAFLIVAWDTWLLMRFAALIDSRMGPAFVFGGATFVFSLTELKSRRTKRYGMDPRYWCTALPCALVIAGVYAFVGTHWGAFQPGRERAVDWDTPLQLLLPALPFMAMAGLFLAVIRPLLSRSVSVSYLQVIDRLSARCLGPALLWIAFAGLWWIVPFLGSGMQATVAPGLATTGAAGLFMAVRGWLNAQVSKTRSSRLLERISEWTKPVLPQVLAYLVALGMLILAALCVRAIGHGNFLHGAVAALGVFVLLVGAIDPQRIGLHEFYRSRIAATFLSTSHDPQCFEDVRLRDLAVTQPQHRRPLHLVCTNGNILAGDALANLNRGGRSVAISPLGISVGKHVAEVGSLWLSSALTASAAAFNSQMGSVSKHVGPTVAFIMSALGLRLGLWVTLPGATRLLPAIPGLYLIKEMLGWSNASDKHVHLSDGGHFENLALYELLRRRCRYVIVSDCGADGDLAFDDLANAVRRVREDFGIEIEVDVEPLRSNEDGLAEQHAVVGTIHYDGVTGADKGILVYFKPTLVGDEPADVMQYRTRNPAFPHESTADQFYDEAQWESYRRLGEHCAGTVFSFVQDEKILTRENNAVERLFLGAVQRWQRLRNVDPERMAALIARRDALLADIRASAPIAFQVELFSDVAESLSLKAPRLDEHAMLGTLQFCIELTSLFDQVFQCAQLETHWAHQSNQVWMTFLHRCAATPSYRRFWLLLRPLCSNGLRDFMRVRFGLRIVDVQGRAHEESDSRVAELRLRQVTSSSELTPGFAVRHWTAMHGELRSVSKALEYVVTWPDDQTSLVLGFLLYQEEGSVIRWSNTQLFVPPTLEGAGVHARLLDAAISQWKRVETTAPLTLEVSIDDSPPGRTEDALLLDPAHRQARIASLHFYKSRGFTQRPDDERTVELHLPGAD